VLSDNTPVDKWYPYGHYSEGTGIERKKGWITPAHHVLYNIVREKPIDRGFQPASRKPVVEFSAKCYGPDQYEMRYYYYRDGCRDALDSLCEIVTNANKGYNDIIKQGYLTNMTFQYLKRTHKFLEPFKNSITLTDLCSIDIERFKKYQKKRFDEYKERSK